MKHGEGDSEPESIVGLDLGLDDSFVTLEPPPLQSFLQSQDEPFAGDVAPIIIPSNSASIFLVIFR